jgi:6-phosphogluconolactonase
MMRMRYRHILLLPIALVCLASAALWSAPQSSSAPKPGGSGERLFYVGTYTTTKGMPSKGIYSMRLNMATGALSAPQLAGETIDPSFLVLHPTKRLLYAVNETNTFNGAPGGGVTAFSINAQGGLTRLNDQSSGGSGPCYISLDRTGAHAFVANYGSGSISVLPITADGSLQKASAFIQHEGSGANKERQKGPHAHSIDLDPSGKFVLSADLGLDKVLVYRFDAKAGTLTPNDPPAGTVPPGDGARHVKFHPNGRIAYVINEIKSTITVFTWDAARGTLQEIQTLSALPADFTGTSYTSEIHVHPSGKFVYGSNRGHDSIAIFSVDEKTGKLTSAGFEPTRGNWPRYFGIDPSGTWLLAGNQRSDTISVYKIDTATGKLTPTGTPAPVPSPVSFVFPRN